MPIEWFPTANSRTKVAYDPNWLVLDLGSGHQPHPRADILLDRYPLDTSEVSGRSGRVASVTVSKPFVMADACALPFKDNTFDFIICSHVAEHVKNIDKFCAESNRVGQAGYIETPSKFAEILRHPPYHIWFVSNKGETLIFEPAPEGYPLGWFGKLFFSLYFYQGVQLSGKDVFNFAYGCRKPWHSLLVLNSYMLRLCWRQLKVVTYTRFLWKNRFFWKIN